jgi:aldose sugar dehydrogenase
MNILRKKKSIILLIVFLIAVSLVVYFARDAFVPSFFQPQEPKGVERGIENDDLLEEDVEVVMGNLEIPWEIVFLPNEDVLVTQRTGQLLYISNWEVKERFEIEGVNHIGEGGLLGMTLHPEYEINNYLYLYFTSDGNSGIENKVVRYRFEDRQLLEEEIIIDQIPGGRIHNGGRIAFGPDGYLYISTGDAGDENLSQDIESLAGKILRITDEGEIPAENPFNSAVYSYGHRNPQGIVWDSQERLWSTEHGPVARDELNLIELGKNYGWPVIRGNEQQDGMETPIVHSGDDYTWAPSGMTYWDGSLFFTGLRGQSIYEAKIDNSEVDEVLIHFETEFGRIRTIQIGPDGLFYVLTNNTDGRGNPEDADDRIIRINRSLF